MFNFESIVIPSSVTDETDFAVMSSIYNACKPVCSTIIKLKLSEFAFIESQTNELYANLA